MARSQARLLERALTEAKLRFGPQTDQLTQLLGDRQGQLAQELAANRKGARVMREAITEATPDILGGYDDALSTVQAQQQAVMGMPGAEVSAEQQNAFGRRIGEQRANLNEDLAQQLVAAATSRVYSDRFS